MHLTKTNGGAFDNDAKACYDRIIANCTNICAQRLGLPEKACRVHATLLREAKYRLKTMLGISETSYTSSDEFPLYGPGQGGTGSAFIWAIVSAIILEIMKQEKRGVQFTNPTLERTIQRVMDAFVDDTTAWLNNFLKSLQQNKTEKLEELATTLQDTAQAWEQLLYSTGGALELSKCFYYIIAWKWNKEGRARLATPDDIAPRISVTSSKTGNSVEIEMKDCREAHKTLGVMQNPACTHDAEYK